MPSARVLRLGIFLFVLLTVLFITVFREALTRHARSFIWSPENHELGGEGIGNMNDADSSMPAHTYLSNGLVEVHSGAPHPIYELVKKAEAQWVEKFRRSSKSLEEAVDEYRLRYKRNPPKGFDLWWKYVEDNNVQLPDEYDQIWWDLEVFWGYHPSDLQRLQLMQESSTDSYTIAKNTSDGKVSVVGFVSSDPNHPNRLRGADEIVNLLNEIREYLPPFRAVISPHDNPNFLSDYTAKNMLIEAARSGTFVNMTKLIEAGGSTGWTAACPASTMKSLASGVNNSNLSSQQHSKSFIYDHIATMDPCSSPQLLNLHGQFLANPPGPGSHVPIVPQFAYSSTKLHSDIQFPSLLNWVDDIWPRSDDPPWEDKLDERLSWRGSNTGLYFTSDSRWADTQRARLVTAANKLNGSIAILVPPADKNAPTGNGTTISQAKINPAMLDIDFAGTPIQCAPDFCNVLAERYEWRKRQTQKEAGNFKFVIDVDGNAWSSRFKRLITSNSLVFKASIYPEWFLDRIQPWVHYVPVQVDLSDMYDTLVFFRGGMYGEGAHDELARKIALSGREWGKSFWRREDLTAYVFRLMLEYARVMNTDRDAMTYYLETT